MARSIPVPGELTPLSYSDVIELRNEALRTYKKWCSQGMETAAGVFLTQAGAWASIATSMKTSTLKDVTELL